MGDLEAPLRISELNNAIPFFRLKNKIALFSSEMCRGAPKSTSHPQAMLYVMRLPALDIPIEIAF